MQRWRSFGIIEILIIGGCCLTNMGFYLVTGLGVKARAWSGFQAVAGPDELIRDQTIEVQTQDYWFNAINGLEPAIFILLGWQFIICKRHAALAFGEMLWVATGFYFLASTLAAMAGLPACGEPSALNCCCIPFFVVASICGMVLSLVNIVADPKVDRDLGGWVNVVAGPTVIVVMMGNFLAATYGWRLP